MRICIRNELECAMRTCIIYIKQTHLLQFMSCVLWVESNYWTSFFAKPYIYVGDLFVVSFWFCIFFVLENNSHTMRFKIWWSRDWSCNRTDRFIKSENNLETHTHTRTQKSVCTLAAIECNNRSDEIIISINKIIIILNNWRLS